MTAAGDLCTSCGYWVATIGCQCDACFDGVPSVGLEACVVASAIAWRRALPIASLAGRWATTDALIDAVDRLLEAS